MFEINNLVLIEQKKIDQLFVFFDKEDRLID